MFSNPNFCGTDVGEPLFGYKFELLMVSLKVEVASFM